MDKTAHLIFELNNNCNLAGEHDQCPINLPDRYGNLDQAQTLTDDVVVSACEVAYRFGFAGHVAFHYYNEPMLAISRILKLIEKIKTTVPQARFLLWTNGTLINEANAYKLAAFDKIVITNYDKRNYEFVARFCEDTTIDFWGFDSRATNAETISTAMCARPFNELIFDHYGNAHVCCIDFRGKVELGNLFSDPVEKVIDKYKTVRALCYGDGVSMKAEAPEFCKNCALRHNTTLGKP